MPTIYDLLVASGDPAQGNQLKANIIERLIQVRANTMRQPSLLSPLFFSAAPDAAPPPASRFCLHSRFPDTHAVYDTMFPTYNAVTIPGTPYVFAEGPDPLNMQACSRFFANTLNNPNFPLRLFLAVGRHNERSGYYDYFTGRYAVKLSIAEAITLHLHAIGEGQPELLRDVLSLFADKGTNFGFSLFRQEVSMSYRSPLGYPVGMAAHFPSWPDHGIADLAPGDLLYMLLLAKLQPRLIAHCAAGCGRSATMLLAIIGFQEGLHRINDPAEIVEKFVAMVAMMRSRRPGALSNNEQCLLALQWIASLGQLYQQHEGIFSRLNVLPFADDEVLYSQYKAAIAPIEAEDAERARLRRSSSDGSYEDGGSDVASEEFVSAVSTSQFPATTHSVSGSHASPLRRNSLYPLPGALPATEAHPFSIRKLTRSDEGIGSLQGPKSRRLLALSV